MSDMVEVITVPTIRIARLRFQRVGKLYHFDATGFDTLNKGDYVIVETMRGRQMAEVVDFNAPDNDEEHKPILRLATPAELLIRQEWDSKGLATLIDVRELASRYANFEELKFLAAQFNYDGSTLTVMYSVPEQMEGRINLNRLRNEVSGIYRHARVEFRQIGPRDVARIQGGLGACGIPRCCSTFLTEFSPVSIKMAKAQGISLNPTEITGMCGRLRCCLVYEYEQYVQALKELPRRNRRVRTPHGDGRVLDVMPLLDSVVVLIEDTTYKVERKDLVPLDEYEALERKSQAGCSRHESGGCDCGAKSGKKGHAPSDDHEGDDLLELDELL